MKPINDLFICRCGDPHHQLIISYDGTIDYGLIYVTVHLRSLSIWKRIIHGIFYILGKKSVYGDFEEIILDKIQINELSNKLNIILNNMDQNSNRHIGS